MEEFNTRILLSKLPPREKHTHVADAHKILDFSNTVVESFTRDIVERITEDAFVINDDIVNVMAQLDFAQVSTPVHINDLKKIKIPGALKREKRVYARLLRALNGSSYRLVAAKQLSDAAARERVIAGNDFGWGSPEAITAYSGYISKLLLRSVGVDADILPSVKSVPAAIKAQIDDAWRRACFHHSWEFIPLR